MGLGRKNLVYSMALAGVMLLFLVGYFVYMLPSLYVDYVIGQNLESVREQHNSYIRNGTYEGVQVRNSAACFSIEIPMDGNYILVTGKSFSAEVTMTDERLTSILEHIREEITAFGGSYGSWKSVGSQQGEDVAQIPGIDEDFEELADIFRGVLQEDALPIDIRLLEYQDMEEEFHNESVKIHFYSDTMMVIEAGVEDSNNKYTNYIAVEQTENSLVFSVLPVIAPDMDEIRPIVLQSLPMLGAVILLLVLLFSQVYSRGIVAPIVGLVQYTRHMKHDMKMETAGDVGYNVRTGHSENAGCAGNFTLGGSRERRTDKNDIKDEVRLLADALDDFYLQIKESYHKLGEANKELEEENKRQEIFLRASSHQLKTPIAAALLLVDGMMNEIGRYKDTKLYLPKVREQLLSMRKMVEDILYLNHCADDMQMRQIGLEELLEERLQCYQVAITEKQLSMNVTGMRDLAVYTDERMIGQILDNLLSNAVKYTPVGGQIEITLYERGTGQEIRIENFGVTIPEELLPHIFEPFVSGNHDVRDSGTDSHGLGLYIASYYARKLKAFISVRNGENSVVSTLGFDSFAKKRFI